MRSTLSGMKLVQDQGVPIPEKHLPASNRCQPSPTLTGLATAVPCILMRNKRSPTPANARAASLSPEQLAQLVGARVRSARQAAGLSQEALATEMKARGFNWRQTTVTKAEGATRPNLFVEVAALGQILGRDIEYFYTTSSVTEDLMEEIQSEIDGVARELERKEIDLSYTRSRLERHRCAYAAAAALDEYRTSLDSGVLRDKIDGLISSYGRLVVDSREVFEAVGVPPDAMEKIDETAMKEAIAVDLELYETMPSDQLQYDEQLPAIAKLALGETVDTGFSQSYAEGASWASWLGVLLTDSIVQNFALEGT